jgi:hypothetical protein
VGKLQVGTDMCAAKQANPFWNRKEGKFVITESLSHYVPGKFVITFDQWSNDSQQVGITWVNLPTEQIGLKNPSFF